MRVYTRRRGERRWRMLEMIREYAAERLAGSGEEAMFRKHHAATFLALAEELNVACFPRSTVTSSTAWNANTTTFGRRSPGWRRAGMRRVRPASGNRLGLVLGPARLRRRRVGRLAVALHLARRSGDVQALHAGAGLLRRRSPGAAPGRLRDRASPRRGSTGSMPGSRERGGDRQRARLHGECGDGRGELRIRPLPPRRVPGPGAA